MNGGHDDVRLLADALHSGGEDARPRDDCPAADQIWAAARQELPLDDRLAVIDHTIECPVCAEAWRLATAFTPVRAAAPANRPARMAWLRPRVGWAAAALVLAAGAAVLLRAPEPEPVSREPARELRPLVPSGASLPRDAFRLQWSGGPPDARYDLVVTTSDLQPVVTVRGLEQPEYLVPAERLSGTPSGARLLWRVTARSAAGGAIASPTFEVALE